MGVGNPLAIVSRTDETIVTEAARLLEAVGYTGFANFDIKVDPRDGSHYFFEINTRLGRSNYYVTAAGDNVARWLMDDLVLGRPLPEGLTVARGESLYTVVPKAILLDYIRDDALRREVRGLYALGRDADPLDYPAEKSLRRRLYPLVFAFRQWKTCRAAMADKRAREKAAEGLEGAGATAMQRLVERTEARCDQDHVRTLAFNDTAIPDRTAFLLGRSDRSPLEALIEDGRLLEACGCDLLALPCNTAHGFFDELQGALGIPVVHMVRETAAAASAVGLARIGVLATSGTVATDLYGREAARLGVDCLYPDATTQGQVNRVIFDEVKAGRPVDAAALERLAAPFRVVGCDGVVLGCTELSLAFGGVTRAAGLPVVDALDVLADCVIMRAGRPSKTSKNLSLQN